MKTVDARPEASRPARLLTLSPELGVIDLLWPARGVAASPLLASALAFARDVVMRWSTERAGEPTPQLLHAPALAVELQLAREAMASAPREAAAADATTRAAQGASEPVASPSARWLPVAPVSTAFVTGRYPAPVPTASAARRFEGQDHTSETGGSPSEHGARAPAEVTWRQSLARGDTAPPSHVREVERVFRSSSLHTIVERVHETEPSAASVPPTTVPGAREQRGAPRDSTPRFDVEALTTDVLGAFERRLMTMRERKGRF